MYEMFWYWFVVVMEGVVAVETSTVKYISDKSDNRVSANRVYIKFPYFMTYFNQVFQDTI